MLESLGFEEVLLVVVLGLVLFSPREIAAFVRKFSVMKSTAQSWAQGMWKGWME